MRLTPAQMARKLRERANALRGGKFADALRAQVVAVLADDAMEGFTRSEDPDGTPWKPLKKPRGDGTKKPLVKTGTLRDAVASLRHLSGSQEPGFSQVQARAPYAVFHQVGTRKIPRRRFIGIGSRGQRRLDRAVAAWANNWLVGVGEG